MAQTWNSPAFLPVEAELSTDESAAAERVPVAAREPLAKPLAAAREQLSSSDPPATVASGTSSISLPNEASSADDAATPRRPSPLVLVEELLREPTRFLNRLDRTGAGQHADGDTPELARSLVAVVALTGALFGGAVGMFRGGIQTAYCATKVPLVLLVTLAVSAPAFLGLARATRTDISARGLVLLALGACARFGLVLAGLAPVLWLLETSMGYHRMIIATVLACAVAGATAGSLLFRGLARARGNGGLAGIGAVLVFALVGGHASWMLRPFVVRPRTEHVPFLRPVESDLAASVAQSTRSAAEIYDTAVQRTDPRRRPAGQRGSEEQRDTWEQE
jgi:hypothetical protein